MGIRRRFTARFVLVLAAVSTAFSTRGLSDVMIPASQISIDIISLESLNLSAACRGCLSTADQGELIIAGAGFELQTPDRSIPFELAAPVAAQQGIHLRSPLLPDYAVIHVQGGKTGFDAEQGWLLIEGGDLLISAGLADVLGKPEASGLEIGTITTAVSLPADLDVVDGSPLFGGVAGSIGPDVIVGELHNFNNYGTNGTISAFSVGTVSCNVGDTPLIWIAANNQHPVIGQNMYRLKDGRFEQIGQSWLKHGFLALAENACNLGCQNPGTGALLGIGCSDPYSANLNGQQGNLGPKSEVNAHTGFFPYPPGNPPWSGAYDRRLQVRNSDLDPAQDGGGKYFVEGQYVAADDAAAGNNNNNASYREITISAGPNGSWNMAFAGPTMRQRAAIRAWRDNDPTVLETEIQIPGDGHLILAARAAHLGNGLWHYEYALQNLNSDRSVNSFTVPVPDGAVLHEVGFHDVSYHSGEPYTNVDWTPVQAAEGVTWSTDLYNDNPNANALRWGTMYNFRFSSHLVPTTTQVRLGLFKNGGPVEVFASTVGPAVAPVDCNGNSLDDRCDLDCNALPGGVCQSSGSCGTSFDCDQSGQPDECETDCNANGLLDACDLNSGASDDCNSNGVPDECDPDFDGDGTPDACDGDIDGDGVPNAADVCDFTPLGLPIRASGTMVGDINNDCDIDWQDYSHFDTCMNSSGPTMPPHSVSCLNLYDYQQDGDIDLGDFAGIANAFTGN